MASQAERLVRIEKDGRQRSVTEADYKHRKMGALNGQTYEADGWKVVSWEDGMPYDGEPTARALVGNTAVGIGESASNVTTVDGDKAADDLIASSDVVIEEPITRSRKTPEGE